MEIIQSIATKNPCYKAGKKINIQGIMIEGVGCPQPSAKVFAHNWNREKCEGRCAHAFVDANDGQVIQMLPWNHRGWHAGRHSVTKKSANHTHIGVKLCEPTQIRYKKKDVMILVGDKASAISATKRTYESAVELCAMLCGLFDLDPIKDIISQKEGHDQGIAADRSDVELLWETLKLDYTMDGFRTDVKSKMDENIADIADKVAKVQQVQPTVPIPVEQVLSCKPEVKETQQIETVVSSHKLEVKEVVDDVSPVRKIQVDVINLRIRSTPMIGNNVTGRYTGKGIFEITEIQNGSGSKNGWGKLADGSGWVSLDYVTIL